MTRLTTRAALVCLLAGATPATTFKRATTRDLVGLAERVCCVRCESVEERLDPGSGLVFTHVRLRLLEDIKGRGEGTVVTLRIVGGTAGNLRTEVAGMPRFKRGEESVVFLGKRNRVGFPVVVQARRGVFALRRDKQGRRLLRRAVNGMPGLDEKWRVSLDDFRGSVKRVVRENEKARR